MSWLLVTLYLESLEIILSSVFRTGSADAQQVSAPACPHLSIRSVAGSCLSWEKGPEQMPWGHVLKPTRYLVRHLSQYIEDMPADDELPFLCKFQLVRLVKISFINKEMLNYNVPCAHVKMCIILGIKWATWRSLQMCLYSWSWCGRKHYICSTTSFSNGISKKWPKSHRSSTLSHKITLDEVNKLCNEVMEQPTVHFT